jgi:hypothetical protein
MMTSFFQVFQTAEAFSVPLVKKQEFAIFKGG